MTPSGLYYKPMTMLIYDSRVVNKPEASLTDDVRVVTYNRHMFIVQATGHWSWTCGGYRDPPTAIDPFQPKKRKEKKK
jgi:hypothetical protein